MQNGKPDQRTFFKAFRQSTGFATLSGRYIDHTLTIVNSTFEFALEKMEFDRTPFTTCSETYLRFQCVSSKEGFARLTRDGIEIISMCRSFADIAH